MRQDLVPALNALIPAASEAPGDITGASARREEFAEIARLHENGQALPEVAYLDDETALWVATRKALAPLHARHACWEYGEHARVLALPHDQVPQLSEVSPRLERLSGFRLAPAEGRHDPLAFVQALAKGDVLCPQYLRHSSCMEFSPEPDLIHGLIGHASSLTSPVLADLNRMFARRAQNISCPDELKNLARVYWFTMELGVVREGPELRAYGAALLSSRAELRGLSLAALRPLDLKAMESLELVATDVQHVLFCAPSFDSMCRTLTEYLSL